MEKILNRIEAFLSGHFVPKTDLQAVESKLSEVSAELEKAKAESEASAKAAEEATSKLEAESQAKLAAEAKVAEQAKAIETLQEEAKTVDEAAAKKAREICAAQGIPAANVPGENAGSEVSEEKKLENVRSQIAAETDPVKRAELCKQARELRGHADLFGRKKAA